MAIVIVPGPGSGLNGGVESPGKIVVVRGGAVGDFIVTLPVLAALRQRWPGARLEVVAQSNVAPLAEASGLADAWWPLESRVIASFFAFDGKLDESMKQAFAGSDLVVSYLNDLDEVFRKNVTRCGIGSWIQGPSRIDARGNVHAAEQLTRPLESLGVTISETDFRLQLPVAQRFGKWLAVHSGSGSEQKNWPLENWIELLARLVDETEFNALLIGGEADGGKVQRLAAELPRDRVELAEHLPLVALGGRMAGCVAFAGHDSGIAHLAAALGMAGVVLWGPSSRKVWQPMGLEILEHPGGLAAIDVRLAWETLQDCLIGLS